MTVATDAIRRDVSGAVSIGVGTYLGVVEGLSVPSGHAFDLDRDDNAYVLIAPGSLRSVEELCARPLKAVAHAT